MKINHRGNANDSFFPRSQGVVCHYKALLDEIRGPHNCLKFFRNGWESWFSFEPMRKFLDLNVNNRRVLQKWPSVSSRHIIWSADRKDETKSAFRLVIDLPYSPRRYIPHRPAGNDLVLVILVCMLGALLTLSKFKQEFSCFYFYFWFFFSFRFYIPIWAGFLIIWKHQFLFAECH